MDFIDEPDEIENMDEPSEIDSSIDGRYLKYDDEIGQGRFKTVWKGEADSWLVKKNKNSLG